MYIPPEAIEELGQSLKGAGGQRDSILVKRLSSSVNGCDYELVHGEIRWRAHIFAKINTIDARVISVKDQIEQLLIPLVSQFQTNELTWLEIAYSIQKLDSWALSRQEIAERFGKKSASWTDKYLNLLKLSPKVLALAEPKTPEEKRLSLGHAGLLIGLPEDQQISFAKTISEHQLSVEEAKRLIASIRSPGSTSSPSVPEEILGFVKKTQLLVSKWSSMADKQFQVEMNKIKWRDREELMEKLESICGELTHLKESIGRTQKKAKTK
jgi:ParB family chromosome partitioning protein